MFQLLIFQTHSNYAGLSKLNNKGWPESELHWNDFSHSRTWTRSMLIHIPWFVSFSWLAFAFSFLKWRSSSHLYMFSFIFPPYLLISKKKKPKNKEVHYSNKYSSAKFTGPWDSSFFPILQCSQMTDQLKRTKLTGGPKMSGDHNKELCSPETRKQISSSGLDVTQFQPWP